MLVRCTKPRVQISVVRMAEKQANECKIVNSGCEMWLGILCISADGVLSRGISSGAVQQ